MTVPSEPDSTDAGRPLRIGAEQIAAFRVAQQGLLEREGQHDLPTAAGAMAGAQAQLLSAAALSLGARMDGLSEGALEQALYRERSVAIVWCVRATLHVVPGPEAPLYVRGTVGRVAREVQWFRGKGHSIPELERLIDGALDVLAEPLTVEEFARRLADARGAVVRMKRGGGWGSRSRVPTVPLGKLDVPATYLLRLVGLRGVVCRGPPSGARPTFVRADRWLRNAPAPEPVVAEEGLLHRYLRAFGPADARDFSVWSGLRLRTAREVWARCADDIAPVESEGQRLGVLRPDIEALAAARFEGPVVRLLPYFDGFLMGHRDRRHLLPDHHRGRVSRPQGWIAPTVLVNGSVAGTWEYRRSDGGLEVRVTPLSSGLRTHRALLQREANRIAEFYGAGRARLEFVPRPAPGRRAQARSIRPNGPN